MSDEYILQISDFLNDWNSPILKIPNDFPIIKPKDYSNRILLNIAMEYITRKLEEFRIQEFHGINISIEMISLHYNFVIYYTKPILMQKFEPGRKLLETIIEKSVQPLFMQLIIAHWENKGSNKKKNYAATDYEYFIKMSKFLNKWHKYQNADSLIEKPVDFPIYYDWEETIATDFSEFIMYITSSIALLLQKIFDDFDYVQKTLFSWHYYIMKDYAKIILDNGTPEDQKILQICAHKYIEPFFMKIMMNKNDEFEGDFDDDFEEYFEDDFDDEMEDIDENIDDYSEDKVTNNKPHEYLTKKQGKNSDHDFLFIGSITGMALSMLYILIFFGTDYLENKFGEYYSFPLTELFIIQIGTISGFIIGFLIKRALDVEK